MLTQKSIAYALSNVKTDGSSWLVQNKFREYNDKKLVLIDSLKFDYAWERISSDEEVICQLRVWRDTTDDWEEILRANDVAMFPSILNGMKSMYMSEVIKEYCEDVTRLSYCSVNDYQGKGALYHDALVRVKSAYGVFRLRCVIGDNMLKMLRRHLKVTEYDFTVEYGLSLHDDSCFCDDLLIEMLVTGHLVGGVRSYKIEREYF